MVEAIYEEKKIDVKIQKGAKAKKKASIKN